MNTIRKIRNPEHPKREVSLTKTGLPRKRYTVRNPRKSPTKEYSINIALSAHQKAFLEKKAEKLEVRPAEIVRRILDVFCRDIIILDDVSSEFKKDFNICKIEDSFDKEELLQLLSKQDQ